VAIYELAISHPLTPFSHTSTLLNQKRTTYLIACLETCRACTEHYLNSDLICITIASGLIFSYCVRTLHRLSTLQDPNWDTAIVRETVDVVGLLERCAVLADRSNEKLKKETGEDSIFIHAARTLRETAPSWRVSTTQDLQTGGDSVTEGWSGAEAMDLPLMDFSDDFWLNAPFNL
jgi:hypothetical protein